MENTELQKQWRERIADYRNSGLTAAAWCERNDCSIARLQYWIAKFKRANKKSDETKWAKIEIVDAHLATRSSISIYVGTARIEVNAGFEAGLLEDVLRSAVRAC